MLVIHQGIMIILIIYLFSITYKSNHTFEDNRLSDHDEITTRDVQGLQPGECFVSFSLNCSSVFIKLFN